MTDYGDVVEELREMDAGDRVWVEIDSGGMWMMCKQPAEYALPKQDCGGDWVGGSIGVELRPPGRVVDGMDLVLDDSTLTMESDEDEWVRDPVIRLAEDKSEDGYSLWTGEKRTVEEIGVVVSQGVWRERERAASSASGLIDRQSSVARVILADVVVSYVASGDVGDVWEAYVGEDDEGSVSGFLEWVSARDFQSVLGEQGGELFPEFEDEMDVSQRTSKDALGALRYFRGE